jgi:3-isopropylmalate/(R)-2-methylmalate dehydratase small subunit
VVATSPYKLAIDLEQQTVTMPSGEVIRFDIEPFQKHCLLNGLDEIGLSLQYIKEIESFEKEHRRQQPWLFNA